MNEKIQKIKELSDDIGVLYVEDNIGLSNNMQTLLSRMFHKIYIAHDGEDGRAHV